jgi:diaminopimelate epimerase
MRFSKWHALGNDYLLIERSDGHAPLEPVIVRRLCEVHRGIGADGILEVALVEGPRAEIVVWNPDGSTAELSGNGTRIAARWLARREGVERVVISVGSRDVVARVRGVQVEQALGAVTVGATETLRIEDGELTFTPVSVGNPHAVLRQDPDRDAVLRIGPLLERHPRFPERTNVQLVRVESTHHITVGVWERGAGETLSSGTSACAAAAAAIANGWCVSPVVVSMSGGNLGVSIDGSWSARLSGDAHEICSGEVSQELLEAVSLDGDAVAS